MGTRCWQVAPQELTRANLALEVSRREGLPVRVIRGAGHRDQFVARPGFERFSPPQRGYRYDGLYRVEDCWPSVGRSGHRIWRFRLVLIDEGVAAVVADPVAPGGNETPGRSIVTGQLGETPSTRRA